MQIITDSSCDLPKEIIEENKILVVPLRIEIDGKDYVDGEDLSHREFMKKMTASPTLPKTSQPSPRTFVDRYREGLKNSEDVLSIHLSSKLSGTYDGAHQAKKRNGW